MNQDQKTIIKMWIGFAFVFIGIFAGFFAVDYINQDSYVTLLMKTDLETAAEYWDGPIFNAISLSAGEFYCDQDIYPAYTFDDFNSIKARALLGHEFLHMYDYEHNKSQASAVYKDIIYTLEPLHQFGYFDNSIREDYIEGNYLGAKLREEYYVRVVNFCFYANQSLVYVPECQGIDMKDEFEKLTDFFNNNNTREFVGRVCVDHYATKVELD